MSRTSFSITFYCRESKKNKHNLSPLELCLCINQERLFINLPAKFQPKDFNKKRRPKEIEEMINLYRGKVNDIINQLLFANVPITASSIREYLKTGGKKSKTVLVVVDEFLQQLSLRKGKSITVGVYDKYVLVKEFLTEHLSNKEITSVTNGDIIRLYDILKSKYLPSTSAGYLTKIKTMFQYANDNGYISFNPCNGIKITKGIPTVKYLSVEELTRIKNLKLEDYERLERVKDLLIFQCSVGMAYCDLIRFDSNNIEVIDGVPTYTGNRQKTGVEYTTVIMKDGMEILKKYDGSLPIISNQKYNIYLKEIQKLAKIDTVITSHLLRKTYAHHLLNNGVRIETVAKCLGHSNTSITQRIYAKTMSSTVAKEVGKIIKGGLI